MGEYRWLRQVYSTEIRKVLTYRFDFWINFFVSIFAHVAVAFFLWRAVFQYNRTDTMQGYSFTGLMLYYLMVPMIDKIVNGSGMGFVSRDIYDGSLTRYLIYPVSFFKYKYVQHLANTSIFIVQLLLTIFIFTRIFGEPPDVSITPASILMGITAALFSGILSFFIFTSIEMIAFWADNVWTLVVMFRFCIALVGGTLIPLAFFPDGWREALRYLPFPYLVSFPIECATGRIPAGEWAQGIAVILAWSAAFLFILKSVWNRGRYQYTGVGI